MKLKAFVPLVTYPETNADTVVVNAISLATVIGSAIHALAINVDIPNVSNALSRLMLDTPRMIRNAEAASRTRGEELLAAFEKAAGSAGVVLTRDAVTGPIAMLGDIAAAHARYYDLSFVAWEKENQTSRSTAEAVIFGAGRPAIVLPANADISSFDRVAIAWDGSRVAARALADARLFLERAKHVSIITVTDEKPLKEKDAAQRLAKVLQDGGLAAAAMPVQSEDCPIAETLQRTAIDQACTLLVMGGYGHSRMRDFVLGGATEGVLADLRLPILLSH